jgi:hypothetical protein
MNLLKNLRVLAMTVCAIGAIGAVAASPAMAELVDGKFSASTVTLSGSGLTVKKNGGEAKTCELKPATGKTEGATLYVYNLTSFMLPTVFECTGGTKLSLNFMGVRSRYDTVTGQYSLRLNPPKYTTGYLSPYGQYQFGGASLKDVIAGWTNGSEATPSTIDFNETYLGSVESTGASLTLTGSVKATTSAGGLLTLSH